MHHHQAHVYSIVDCMWLENTNIMMTDPIKLNAKRSGPFKILKKEGNAAYHLELPPYWKEKIHLIFNNPLLTLYVAPIADIQQQVRPPPSIINNMGRHYEVEEILDSHLKHHG